MNVPFIDLKMQNEALRPQIMSELGKVFDSGKFILGPAVAAFEAKLAAYLSVKHVVGVSSGTDALLASLMAIGVQPGDQVITTPMTFIATVEAILRLGAEPVFVDIESDSFNMDPEMTSAAITERTRAIIPVHLFGRPARAAKVIHDLRASARRNLDMNIAVVEDAAQAISATPLLGDCGCLSFFPSKNLGGIGDAGAVYTNDDELAHTLRLLRSHGSEVRYRHDILGANFRLDTIHAAVLKVKLDHLDFWTVQRRHAAYRYTKMFGGVWLPEVILPKHDDGMVWNQFVIRATRRDELRAHLTQAGVASEIYYPTPLHKQPALAQLGTWELPEAERAALEVLALPIFPEITEVQQQYVVDQIYDFYHRT